VRAADGGTQDAGVEVAHDPGRYRGGDDAAGDERDDHAPAYGLGAETDQEPYAGEQRDHELRGVDGAYDLARLHPAGR
jgi:hypothetical protein